MSESLIRGAVAGAQQKILERQTVVDRAMEREEGLLWFIYGLAVASFARCWVLSFWWEQFRPSDEVGGRPDWALRTWSNAWAGSEMLAKRLSALLELMRKTHKIFRSIA